MPESFEFPGKYYEIIRKDFRNLAAETDFCSSYLPAGGGRVLDLGCGTGTNLRALAELGHECVGVDQSSLLLEYAAAAGGPPVEYVHRRAVDHETEAQFDLVMCVFVTLNYMRRDELAPPVMKVSRWLKPGGHLVLDIGHMLNFVENYQPYIIAHHERDGILITRMIRHVVNAHEANWRHEETILVRETDGTVGMYANFFDQMVLTGPEVRHLLSEADLKVESEFGSFRKDPPNRRGIGHLIFVATPAARGG